MLKIVAPALAVMAAIYLMKYRKKDEESDAAQESERLTEMAAGAYPGE
jgi:ABC-type phosphate transport system permease subunit